MEQGLPCISTNEGDISDIIEDGKNGFIVEKQQPKSVANKIEYLLQHPEICAAIGKTGRQKFELEFTLTRFEERIKKILEQALPK